MQRVDPWVQRYATEVRAAVRAGHRVDSCIESTRVGIEVARYYGRHIEPVPTAVGYFTAESWAAKGRTGYSVGVTGTGRITAGAWDGHLVGLLAPWLVDFAADLLHRPDRGIDVPGPFIAAVTAEQLADGVAIADTETGVVHTYRAVPDTTWRTSPAWRRHSPSIRAAAATAIRALQTSEETGSTCSA
jgi:hypothetical protein